MCLRDEGRLHGGKVLIRHCFVGNDDEGRSHCDAGHILQVAKSWRDGPARAKRSGWTPLLLMAHIHIHR